LPDVCLLEIDQPGQDAVKKFFREKKLPVIYLVPRSQPELLDIFKIKKPYEYIYTPIDLKDLHTTIETVLFRASLPDTEGPSVPEKNEQAINTLLEKMPGIAYCCLNDKNWTMQFISEGCRELTGYPPSDFIDNKHIPFSEIILPEDRVKIWNEIQRGLKQKNQFTINYRITTKDGRLKWVWEKGNGIPDNQGEIQALVGIITDITSFKEVEKQIKHAHLEKEIILDNLLEHVLYQDRDMNILWANKAACKYLGLPREKVIGRRCHELLKNRNMKYPECPVVKALQTGQPYQTEYTGADGKSWFIQGNPVRNKEGELIGGIEVSLDISDYKQALTALDRSEHKYSELYENIRDGIGVVNLDGKIINCNSALLQMLGYSREELLELSLEDITPRQRYESEKKIIREQILKQGYSDIYQKEYIHKDGHLVPVELRTYLIKDENGQPDGMWAFVRDITLTRQFEDKLKETSSLLSATLEATADGILVVDDSGKVVHANRRFSELWRIPDHIVTTHDDKILLDFVLNQLKDPDAFLTKVQQLYKSDATDLDFLYFKDDRVFERFSHALIRDNRIVGRVWSFRDITEQKAAERQLRANEEKLRAIVEHMPIMMYALDSGGNIVTWNRECERVTGYAADEIVGNPKAMELLYPDRDYRGKMMKLRRQSGNNYRDMERNLICKDGSVKTVSWSSVADQVPISGWVSWDIGQDVTERNKAIEKLERMGMAVEQSFDGIIMVDFEENIVYANQTWAKIHGYEREELKNTKINVFYSGDQHVKTIAFNLLDNKDSSGWLGMTSHVRKDGTTFSAWETITVIRNRDGEPLGYVGAARDITESRRAEQALKESEEKYRLLAETASDMIITHDMQGKITYANEAFIEFSGYSKKLLKEMKVTALLQPPKMDMKLEKKEIHGSSDYHRLIYETELVIKNRKRIPVEVNSTPFWKDKIQVGRLIVARDISERKQAEKALRESEVSYRRIIDNTIDLIYEITPEGSITFCSPQLERYGFKAYDIIGKNLFDFVHPDDVEKLSNDLRRVIETAEIFPSAFRLIGADKQVYHLESISKIVRDENDSVRISGVLRDITDRKMAEEALRLSEEKYRILFDNASNGIFVAQDGVIKFNNPQVTVITGYKEDELKTKPFAQILHKDDREMVVRRHQSRLDGLKVPNEYYFRIIRKDGNIRWLNISAVRITWENRPATLNFITDITERKEAEQALFESQERFRTMADFTYDWESWIGPDDKYIYISPSCERLTGYKAEEFIKRPELQKEIVHPDDREKLAEHMRIHSLKPEPHHLEYRIIARDGSIVWIDHVCQPVYSPDGRYLGRRISNRDVTERQKILTALIESEEKYSTIVEKANDGVILIQDEIILFANKAMGKMLGYKIEEIVGKKYTEMVAPESQELIQRRYRQRLEGKNPPGFYEVRLLCNDGSIKECELSAELINYRGRKASVAMLRDISERRKTEEHLRRNLAAMEAATEGIAIIKKSSRSFTYINRATAHMFGYVSPFEIMLTPWNELLAFKDQEAMELEIKKALEENGAWNRELDGIKKDGSFFPLEISLTAIDDGNIICIFRDISERRENELKSQRLNEELERARRMESLGILAGGVAHDLNNMLGPMVGYSDLILEEIDPENNAVIKMVESISKASRIAADVIQDLLTLARRGRYDMETTNLNTVIENYLDSPSYDHLIKEKPGIEVTVDLDPKIETILGSEPHLSKTIMNLVINAFDAMSDKGKLTISTRQETLEKLYSGYEKIIPGDYIALKVRDTGTGIAPEDIDNIFEPYYSKKKMGTSGSGLGLAVVYGIVKDHHGYYDVLSEVGKGTEFVLYFPVSRIKKFGSSVEKKDLTGTETILVIDDSVQQREIAYDLLTSLGYRVHTAVNGREALKYLAQHPTDLVVLDMIMEKDFDGLDTYREIIKHYPGQKAIITSGFSPTEKVDELQRLGAGGYVKKPFTRRSLGEAVRTELDRTAAVTATP
ncbi:MAG: PAS domain S-box protein, partial [Candidatus Zixiibacteriota bacterium]